MLAQVHVREPRECVGDDTPFRRVPKIGGLALPLQLFTISNRVFVEAIEEESHGDTEEPGSDVERRSADPVFAALVLLDLLTGYVERRGELLLLDARGISSDS